MGTPSHKRRLAALERRLLPPEEYGHSAASERQHCRSKIVGLLLLMDLGPELATEFAVHRWQRWQSSGQIHDRAQGPRPDIADFAPERLKKHLLLALKDFRAMPLGDWERDQEIAPLIGAPPANAETPLALLLSNPRSLTCAPRIETLTKLLPHYTAP